MTKDIFKERPIATLTVHRVSELSPEMLTELVSWLDNQGAFLAEQSREVAKRFTARFYRG